MTDDIVRTCATCAHAYLVDMETFSSPEFAHYNIEHLCSLINPDDRHVGSFMRATSICRRWTQCAYPRRIHPKHTQTMIHDGIWWTDVKAKEKANPQKTLEAWA